MKLVNNKTNAPNRNGTRFLHFLSQVPGLAELSGNDIFNAFATHRQCEYVYKNRSSHQLQHPASCGMPVLISQILTLFLHALSYQFYLVLEHNRAAGVTRVIVSYIVSSTNRNIILFHTVTGALA